MAIQLPNPGLGDGQTGDNEFVMWTKVKDNFSNASHAASKLVGVEKGQVPIAENVNELAHNIPAVAVSDSVDALENNGKGYSAYFDLYGKPSVPTPKSDGTNNRLWHVRHDRYTASYSSQFAINYRLGQYWFRVKGDSIWQPWREIYHSGNTTKEPTTGYLKAASPILHLFNDDLVKEHEAVEQDIIVEKLGTGDYLIKGSTGLSEEGWNLSPPKDIHGNVLCFVEATEADGNINVKTYKRKFDFDIVAIVADYDQPFDIPEGHSVDLRLNNLPLDDFQTEV